jgi:tripartite-type tricarboxylate transporter receptor subunit TctC
MVRRHTILVAPVAVAAALLAGAPAAMADEFPENPIEITELFGAGSSSDLTARVVDEGMSAALGVPVVVVNRPGGGGATGYSHVSSQPAAGYDLVWMSDSVLTTHHAGNTSTTRRSRRSLASARKSRRWPCTRIPAGTHSATSSPQPKSAPAR